MVRMKAPQGATGVTVEGVEYPAVDGFVEVPEAAAAGLQAHGYRRAERAAAAARELAARMERADLIAYLRDKGVAAPVTTSNAKLREKVAELLAAAAAA